MTLKLYPPETTIAGTDAVINFTILPADAKNLSLTLSLIDSSGSQPPVNTETTDGPSVTLVPVSDKIYYIDLAEGNIVFPKVRVQNAGTYLVKCNDNTLESFKLEVVPQKSEN